MTTTNTAMSAASTAEASGRLHARPPSATGLSMKSPTVAPSGLVRMNATQNKVTREMDVQKYRAATTARPAAKTSAPRSYPKSRVSASQSPSAVPSVCENVIVAQ
jgi:hypothetical protein